MSGTRELARIKSVHVGPEDHGIPTVMVQIEGDGWAQGFGGLCLDGKRLTRSFVSDLCETFGVADVERLVDQPCNVLRCFSRNNEPIEGLESVVTGRRFTITRWRRKHFPEHGQSALERKRESLRREIDWADRRADDARRELDRIDAEFVDWEAKQ